MEIDFSNIRQMDGMIDKFEPLREKMEQRMGLINHEAQFGLTANIVFRSCLLVGLSLSSSRNMAAINDIQISKTGNRLMASFFTKHNLTSLYSALLKLRYQEMNIDWTNAPLVSKVIAYEALCGRDYLLQDEHLDKFLTSGHSSKIRFEIPALDLVIGNYGEDMEAKLSINSRSINNSQILVAGATGSGKTNLLALLIQQFRQISLESSYPVNYLLFDYKGEFSDEANAHWLRYFETPRTAILDPVKEPIPFSPFKDFSGRPINEINLYSTEIASALCSLDRASIGAIMNERLSSAIVECYKATNGAPITFKTLLAKYRTLLPKADQVDSIVSVLSQLDRNNIFAKEDRASLIDNCYIVKLDAFPKDGPLAKAIVYFLISKLNTIYEQLEKQEVSEDYVQIRHFTIIDEAHYMLGFDNRPLRNLIAVGRNKGLSIILATQNMADFQSKHFDFYANAQYPLIMKQQTISDPVIKDLFGVSGKELAEVREAIAGLQKGELIIKNQSAFDLGFGRKWKKMYINKLI